MCYKIAEKIDESTAYKNVTHSNQKPNILPPNLHKKINNAPLPNTKTHHDFIPFLL